MYRYKLRDGIREIRHTKYVYVLLNIKIYIITCAHKSFAKDALVPLSHIVECWGDPETSFSSCRIFLR